MTPKNEIDSLHFHFTTTTQLRFLEKNSFFWRKNKNRNYNVVTLLEQELRQVKNKKCLKRKTTL